MIPFKKDITIRFGDTKELFFRVRERTFNAGTGLYEPGAYRDLTGCTVLAQVRATTEGAVLLTFESTLGNQADPVDGKGAVYLLIDAVDTATVTRTVLSGVWDCQITDSAGKNYTFVAGAVVFTKDVSRAG